MTHNIKILGLVMRFTKEVWRKKFMRRKLTMQKNEYMLKEAHLLCALRDWITQLIKTNI